MSFNPTRDRRRWALHGALFGLCFPILALAIRSAQLGASAALAAFGADPLLWIIATAPLFLGLFAYVGGVQQDRVRVLSHGLESTVAERTASLQALLARVQLITEGIGDGIVTLDLTGRVEHASRVAERWLGPSAEGPVWSWLFPLDEHKAEQFKMGLCEVREDVMPFELVADQMPRRFECGDRTLQIEYRQLEGEDGRRRLLLVLSDVTAQLAAERAEQASRELQAVFSQILRDGLAWQRFRGETDALIEAACGAHDELERKRALHTLKGNAAIFGLARFAQVCHALESQLEESGELFHQELSQRLNETWHSCQEAVAPLLPPQQEDEIRLARGELETLIERNQAGASRSEVSARLRSFLLPCIAPMLERLSREAERLATRLGRKLHVEVQGGEVRAEEQVLVQLGPTLVHAVRNAVDHGIEGPLERQKHGKPETATLRLGAVRRGNRLTVIVEDDGAGIDFERLARRAESQGFSIPEDPRELLFIDGFTSRDQVTDVSGRGVGMAAIRAACRRMGGDVHVDSALGKGTRLTAEISVEQAYRLSLEAV